LLFDGFLVVILISERSSSWKMSGDFLKKVVVMQVKDAVKSSLLSTCYAQQALLFLWTKNGCHGKTSDG